MIYPFLEYIDGVIKRNTDMKRLYFVFIVAFMR